MTSRVPTRTAAPSTPLTERSLGDHTRRRLVAAALLLGFGLLAQGCAWGPEPLMETPVLYLDGALDPFAHLSDAHRTTSLPIFYATKRSPSSDAVGPPYGNRPDDALRLGAATVHFGDTSHSWSSLLEASLRETREEPIYLDLGEAAEIATLDHSRSVDEADDLTAAQREFVERIDARLAHSEDPEIVIYVHGAKVDFYRCCVRAAELNHFTGRDLVTVAFDWPSHPNIFSYVWGSDRQRALDSADDLRALIELLSTHTSARRIHLLCYSAGALVTSEALVALHQRHASRSIEDARERLRLGVVLFAASDLPLEVFLDEVHAIHDLAERITVTVSDGDDVLDMAPSWMGGSPRIGLRTDALVEAEASVLEGFPRLEIVDVSYGKEERGFDIIGHHYWYRHPWSSSDVILNVRTDLPPERRGLRATRSVGVWHLPSDYPASARRAVAEALEGEW